MKKLVIILSLALFAACKKDTTSHPDHVNQRPNISALADEEDIYHQYARLAHTEGLTETQLTEIDNFYSALNATELKLFLEASKDILLELCENEDEVNQINSDAPYCSQFMDDVIAESIIQYNKPINQLTTEERLTVLNTFRNKGSGGCITIAFNEQACYNFGFYDCRGWQRVGTPEAPKDCDYEFSFPPYMNFTYGRTWAAANALKWWGGCVRKRSFSQFTGFLIGNGAVNWFYWGYATGFQKKFKAMN